MKKFATLFTYIYLCANAMAQERTKPELLYSNRFSILAGLIQPTVLKGANVELNYFSKRVSFDYSHGMSLDIPASGVFKTQQVVLHLPYSTGFGIGYRFNSFFDVRVEPKLHKWELYYAGETQSKSNMIRNYYTFTIGLGAYYRYMPFKNSASRVLQGITTSASIRFWPKVGSNLSYDKMSYLNTKTKQQETLKAANIGVANTPLLFNIAVGYTFGGK